VGSGVGSSLTCWGVGLFAYKACALWTPGPGSIVDRGYLANGLGLRRGWSAGTAWVLPNYIPGGGVQRTAHWVDKTLEM